MRKSYRCILASLIVLLLLNACTTEKQRLNETEKGRVAGELAYRLLSVAHIVQHFALPYDSRFLPDQAKIQLIDSTTKDGDGYMYRVDFGAGLYCLDGLKRKGTFTIELSDTTRAYSVRGTWGAAAADSFAVLTLHGWEKIYGFLDIHGLNADSARLSYNLYVLQNKDVLNVSGDSTSILNYYTDGNFNHYKTGCRLSAEFSFRQGDNFFHGSSVALDKQPYCLSNWNSGTMKVTDEAGNTWNLDMDPFGNNACDLEFKVSRKGKTQKMEMVFKAW